MQHPLAPAVSPTLCRTALAARWFLACCSAATLHAGCSADADPSNTIEPATGRAGFADRVSALPGSPGAPAPVSRQLVDDVRLVRWHAWDRLAATLPDGHVLSVEILHSRPGAALAVFTVVRDHHAVQSVVEAAPQPIRLAADEDVASPDGMALGEPPPKQPPEPGIVTQGRSLLDAAFSDDPVVSASIALGIPPPQQPPEPGVVAQATPNAPPATVTVSSAQVDQVRIARWHAWEQLALARPDGAVLAVELLHSQPGASLAVFTIVRDHRAVQSIVTSDRQPPRLADADDPVSPDGVAIGEPPPKEPPQPGIVAQGTSLLNAAFGTNAPAQ